MQTCKSGNFHGALNSSGQHAGPLVVCMCESHVELQGNEVCRPLVWMKRMSKGLEGMLFIIFCVCVWDCVVLLLYCFCCCVSYSFSALLLLCNLLFCRHQTLLSKDTNVCSVVMDMLGFQLQSLSPCCCVGVFFMLNSCILLLLDLHKLVASHATFWLVSFLRRFSCLVCLVC